MSEPPASQDALLAVAMEAAEAAARELVARFGGQLTVETKSTDTDPVSDADVAAETAVRAVLAARRPGDAILGEEGGLTLAADGAQPTGLRWVVDPLDGTVNYLYGIPRFAVSVAVEDSEGALAGVVINPSSGEIFRATRSGTAVRLSPPHADEVALAPRGETRMPYALVGTGFGYDAGVRAMQGRVVAELLPRVRDLRRAGAAALDLCSVAAGRLDAYYERGVKPWDLAAGVLLCERAGLSVRILEEAPEGAVAPGSAALPSGVLVAPEAFIDELHALVA
jgi:myo-inositol-1(or 4)-monophosphatase